MRRADLSLCNKNELLKKVKGLPRGPGWKCEILTTKGDIVDKNGKPRIEKLELWKRDPVECIKELISNPAFREHIRYASEPLFEDEERTRPIINEMWTAEWWEKIQVSIQIKMYLV